MRGGYHQGGGRGHDSRDHIRGTGLLGKIRYHLFASVSCKGITPIDLTQNMGCG